MSRKAQSPLEIEWRVMEDLQALDGRYWKEAQGEYHGAFDEIDGIGMVRPLGSNPVPRRPGGSVFRK